jgi:4-amino-4-deoxy-L-arabinose transferase-like glycosyltransferase
MKAIRNHFDYLLFAILLTAYLLLATRQLSVAPIYETDESYTLQVAYEMLIQGKLALPMYRYLGGNIENVWHSFTPLYFTLLSGFMKVFGIGVLQGRVFNLITFSVTMFMVYLIGKWLIHWRVGLVAVFIIMTDQTVLERSRLLRNDYAAAAFALLAFWLFEYAEKQRSTRWYIAAGLAAGAGTMCHLSVIYMIAAISLLMLLKEGWRLIKQRKLYLFLSGALVAMSYEIIYDLIDYNNFRLQYRQDDLHFSVISWTGWVDNLLDEPRRYTRWFEAYDAAFQEVPRWGIHSFQLLLSIAVIYLFIRLIKSIKNKRVMDEPRNRIFIMTLFITVFFAVAAHKAGYYLAHLVTWFGLTVGILINDSWVWVQKLRHQKWRYSKPVYTAVLILIVSACYGYGKNLSKQTRAYLSAVRSLDLAQFDELKSVLRTVVPTDICPVAVKAPVMWLAFQEYDRCFATIENRMKDALDLDGNEYALIMRPKGADHWAKDLPEGHTLLGELRNTAYGNFVIYYTGENPAYRSLPPGRYKFFGRQRGHVSDKQIESAPVIWTINNPTPLAVNSLPPEKNGLIMLGNAYEFEVKPGMIYQLIFKLKLSGKWNAIVLDSVTDHWLAQIALDEEGEQQIEGVFRNLTSSRVKLAILKSTESVDSFLGVTQITAREIIGIDASVKADFH